MDTTLEDPQAVEKSGTGKSFENFKAKTKKLFGRGGDKGGSGTNAKISRKEVPLAEQRDTDPVASQCTIASSRTPSPDPELSSQEGDANERAGALDSKQAITEELEQMAAELESLRNITYPRDGTSDSKHAATKREREMEQLEMELKKLQNKTNLQARTSDSEHLAREREKVLERLKRGLNKLQNDANLRAGLSDPEHVTTGRERGKERSKTELDTLANDTNRQGGVSDSEHVATERERGSERLKTEMNQQRYGTNRKTGASNSEHIVTEREKQLERLLEKTRAELETLKVANAKICEEKRLAAEKAVKREGELSDAVKRAEANLRSSNKTNQEEKKVMLQETKRHKDKLAEFGGLIDSLTIERNDFKNKNQTNIHQIQELWGQVQGYQRENSGLQDQVSQHLSNIRELNHEVFNNKIEISKLEDGARHDQSNIIELQNTVGSLQAEIHYLKQQRDSFKKNHETAENDLNHLQSQIFHIDRGVNPLRSEAYYIEIFQGIRVDFEMSVARFPNASGNMSKNGEAALLQTLKSLGPHSKAASEFLMAKQRLRIWHARARIPLVRHIAAVILFQEVLEPFVFGLSPALSHAFSSIDADIMSHEQYFNKVLTVRQSLSQGASRYIQKIAAERQSEVISQLSKVLSILLPAVSKDNIMNASKKFINDAVALKNSLTEERAAYQFFWVAGGDQLDPESVQVSAGEWGVVGMCTFPGLARKAKEENQILVVNVVKAAARSLFSLER